MQQRNKPLIRILRMTVVQHERHDYGREGASGQSRYSAVLLLHPQILLCFVWPSQQHEDRNVGKTIRAMSNALASARIPECG
jgi:hypothetical protein